MNWKYFIVNPVNKLTTIYNRFNNTGNVIPCTAILKDGANFSLILDILETRTVSIESISTSINIDIKYTINKNTNIIK